jgi:multiple sugar transport system ATP-binding protein
VQQLGTPEEIYNSPANLFVATFMGSPAMNLIPMTLVEQGGGLAAETTVASGEKVRLPFPVASDDLRAHLGRSLLLGLRPEAITDPEGAERGASHLEEVDSEVVVCEPAGSDTFVMTTLGGADVNARMRAGVKPRPGDQLRFTIDMGKALVFDPETELRLL